MYGSEKVNAVLGMKHIIIISSDAWIHNCGCGVICQCGIPEEPLLHSGDPHVRHILKVDYTFQIQAHLFDANKEGNLNHVNVVYLTITPLGTIPPPYMFLSVCILKSGNISSAGNHMRSFQ